MIRPCLRSRRQPLVPHQGLQTDLAPVGIVLLDKLGCHDGIGWRDPVASTTTARAARRTTVSVAVAAATITDPSAAAASVASLAAPVTLNVICGESLCAQARCDGGACCLAV